jgi:polygalacturonase
MEARYTTLFNILKGCMLFSSIALVGCGGGGNDTTTTTSASSSSASSSSTSSTSSSSSSAAPIAQALKVLYVGDASLVVEWDHPMYDIVEKGDKFTITVNGQLVETVNKNVAYLSGFSPEQKLDIQVDGAGKRFTGSFVTREATEVVNVTTYGAKGDGTTDDTNAIQQAINYLGLRAGGRVVVPAGRYRIRPLELKSNVTLDLASANTTLEATENATIIQEQTDTIDPAVGWSWIAPKDTQGRLLGTWEGWPRRQKQPLIGAFYAQNVGLIGKGTIEGHGELWRVPSGTKPWTHQNNFRARLISFIGSSNVTIAGVTAKNSPVWTTHLLLTNNSRILDYTVRNPLNGPNTDGIDLESTDNILVSGYDVVTGDDGLVIKAGRHPANLGWQQFWKPAKNITVRNMRAHIGGETDPALISQTDSAISFGSEMSAGIESIKISNMFVTGFDDAFQLRTNASEVIQKRMPGQLPLVTLDPNNPADLIDFYDWATAKTKVDLRKFHGRGGYIKDVLVEDVWTTKMRTYVVKGDLWWDRAWNNDLNNKTQVAGGVAPFAFETAIPLDGRAPTVQNITFRRLTGYSLDYQEDVAGAGFKTVVTMRGWKGNEPDNIRFEDSVFYRKDIGNKLAADDARNGAFEVFVNTKNAVISNVQTYGFNSKPYTSKYLTDRESAVANSTMINPANTNNQGMVVTGSSISAF